MSVILPSNQIYGVKSAVLENADLLRIIGEYLGDVQLPFVLSFKAGREALKPFNHTSGDKWIHSKKRHFATSITMVEWAQSLGCEFNLTRYGNNLFTHAASNGSVDVLRWAHQKYPPIQYSAGVRRDICVEATLRGHLPVLEYLRSLGNIVKWDEIVCAYAAARGHPYILKWLREVLDPPCPWDHNACAYAAIKGHLHVLQWLRAQDPPCPWNDETCYFTAQEGNLDLLKWLRSQEPPCPWRKQDCFDVASDNNHHQIVEWILSQPE